MEPHRDQGYTQHQRLRSLRCFHQIKLHRLHFRRAMGIGSRLQLEIDRAIKFTFANNSVDVSVKVAYIDYLLRVDEES